MTKRTLINCPKKYYNSNLFYGIEQTIKERFTDDTEKIIFDLINYNGVTLIIESSKPGFDIIITYARIQIYNEHVCSLPEISEIFMRAIDKLAEIDIDIMLETLAWIALYNNSKAEV